MSKAKKNFLLPISPDYVPQWGVWEAVRELIQNMIDRVEEDDMCSTIFDYDAPNERLRVGVTNSKLLPRTLLIGASTKRNNKELIGKHGEGYKLAIMVLLRNIVKVSVHTGAEDWTCELRHNLDYDSHVLNIDVAKSRRPTGDVVFDLEGITSDQYAEICGNWIPNSQESRILDDDHHQGRIFVGGLFVCEVRDFSYGYNFAPGVVDLDRDRRIIDTFQVQYHAGSLWGKASPKRLFNELKKETQDVAMAGQFADNDTAAVIFDLYQREYPGVVPVSSQEDADRYRGQKTRIEKQGFRGLLHSVGEFKRTKRKSSDDCHAILSDFYRRAKFAFPKEVQEDFEEIIEDSKTWIRGVESAVEA